MIKRILVLALLFISGICQATNYYVKTGGDDEASGLSDALAWATIAKVNATYATFNPGDTIFFNRGNTFTGTLDIKKSGTVDSDIVFSAYGTGAKPIILGLTDVTEWTNKGSNIWESTNAVSALTYANYVIIGGVSRPMGRYPNGHGLPDDVTHGDDSWIYDNTFATGTVTNSTVFDSTVIDWTGGELITRPNQYIIKRSAITNHIDHTLYYTSGSNWTDGGTSEGLFIQRHLSTLDVQNEWYFDPSTKKLSIYSTAEPANVKISTADTLINVLSSYVTVNNISLKGANVHGIYIANTKMNVSVEYCDIDYCTNGIYAYGSTNGFPMHFNYNTINHSNNNGISMLVLLESYYGWTGSTITHNVIKNTGLIPGMGFNSNGNPTYSGIASELSLNIVVEYNEVDSSGYCGISNVMAKTVSVKHNFVNYFGMILSDGGGIYLNGPAIDGEISNNIVLNGLGSLQGRTSYHDPDDIVYGYNTVHGIYIDDGGSPSGILVHENTVAYVRGGGLFFGKATNCIWTDNTLYENMYGLWNTGLYTHLSTHVNRIIGNIFFNNGDTAKVGDSFTFTAMGTINYPATGNVYSPNLYMDYNYYCRPKDQAHVIYIYNRSPYHHYSLATWQGLSGKDKHSRGFHTTITNTTVSYFYYNNTALNVWTALPAGTQFIDVYDMRYCNWIVLKPYTSIILMEYSGPRKCM